MIKSTGYPQSFPCPKCEERKKLFPEDILMELVLGYVNDVKDHRIDKKKLAGQISNIIGDIEDLALEVEEGEYEDEYADGDEYEEEYEEEYEDEYEHGDEHEGEEHGEGDDD